MSVPSVSVKHVVGNGSVAKALARDGVVCGLLEPGNDGAVTAWARGIDSVICARTLGDVGLPPVTLADTGAYDVLEHVEDEADALLREHALLWPGGYLSLTVPTYIPSCIPPMTWPPVLLQRAIPSLIGLLQGVDEPC